MRRRRRQSTQIIRKKNIQDSAVVSPYPSAKTSGAGRKFLVFIIAGCLLAIISYYLYSISFFEHPPTAKENTVAAQTQTDSPEQELTEEQPSLIEHRIRIEILNGCGKTGVAKVFQSYLRDKGFDVVNTENYTVNGRVKWDVDESFVINHIGVDERARAVARSLGIASERVENRENPNAIYDVSVVIGKDYKNLTTQ